MPDFIIIQIVDTTPSSQPEMQVQKFVSLDYIIKKSFSHISSVKPIYIHLHKHVDVGQNIYDAYP